MTSLLLQTSTESELSQIPGINSEEQILMLIFITGGLFLLCVVLLIIVLMRNKKKRIKRSQMLKISEQEIQLNKTEEILAKKPETQEILTPKVEESKPIQEKSSEEVILKDPIKIEPEPQIPQPPVNELKENEQIIVEVKPDAKIHPVQKLEIVRTEEELKNEVRKAISETSSRDENLKIIQERLKEILGNKEPANVIENEKEEIIISEKTSSETDLKPIIEAQLSHDLELEQLNLLQEETIDVPFVPHNDVEEKTTEEKSIEEIRPLIKAQEPEQTEIIKSEKPMNEVENPIDAPQNQPLISPEKTPKTFTEWLSSIDKSKKK